MKPAHFYFANLLPLVKQYQPIVLDDREFCFVKLANWLREEQVEFYLRLKKDECVEVETGVGQQLQELGLKPGISLFLKDIKVTKTKNIKIFQFACKWRRYLPDCTPKEG